jgi:hypothetical protein
MMTQKQLAQQTARIEQLAQQLTAVGLELLEVLGEDDGEYQINTWQAVFTTWLLHPSSWAVQDGMIEAFHAVDRGRAAMQYRDLAAG